MSKEISLVKVLWGLELLQEAIDNNTASEEESIEYEWLCSAYEALTDTIYFPHPVNNSFEF